MCSLCGVNYKFVKLWICVSLVCHTYIQTKQIILISHTHMSVPLVLFSVSVMHIFRVKLYSKVYFWNFVIHSLLFILCTHNYTVKFIFEILCFKVYCLIHTYIRINKLFCVCRMTHSNVRERSASKWIHTELKFRVSVPLFYSLCVCMYNLDKLYSEMIFQNFVFHSLLFISKHGLTFTYFKARPHSHTF